MRTERFAARARRADTGHRFGRRRFIPARAFVIRFPNGDFEYDFSRSAVPQIGDTVRRQGALWSVVRITDDLVKEIHVERARDRAADAPQRHDVLPEIGDR